MKKLFTLLSTLLVAVWAFGATVVISNSKTGNVTMNSTDGENFTATVHLSELYKFKISVDGTNYSDDSHWDASKTGTLKTGKGSTYIEPCTEGDYVFDFVLSTKVLTVTYPTCPAVLLTVTIGGYSSDTGIADFTLEEDETLDIYTGSVILPAELAEYTFKVDVDGTKYGVDNCYISETTELQTKKDKQRIHLTINGNGGEYVFQYIHSTKKLTVTFPTPTSVLEAAAKASNVYKVVENGEIVIIKDGVRYNLLGKVK